MDPKEERILDKLDEVNKDIKQLLEGAAGEDLNSTQKELLKRYDCQVEFLQQQLTNTAQGALYVSPPLTLSILPYHS
jgi:hypothetical protein